MWFATLIIPICLFGFVLMILSTLLGRLHEIISIAVAVFGFFAMAFTFMCGYLFVVVILPLKFSLWFWKSVFKLIKSLFSEKSSIK